MNGAQNRIWFEVPLRGNGTQTCVALVITARFGIVGRIAYKTPENNSVTGINKKDANCAGPIHQRTAIKYKRLPELCKFEHLGEESQEVGTDNADSDPSPVWRTTRLA